MLYYPQAVLIIIVLGLMIYFLYSSWLYLVYRNLSNLSIAKSNYSFVNFWLILLIPGVNWIFQYLVIMELWQKIVCFQKEKIIFKNSIIPFLYGLTLFSITLTCFGLYQPSVSSKDARFAFQCLFVSWNCWFIATCLWGYTINKITKALIYK